MANIYKNAFFDLANTDKTDIYTVPSDSRAIIKTIQANNHAGSNPELEGPKAQLLSDLQNVKDGAMAQLKQKKLGKQG